VLAVDDPLPHVAANIRRLRLANGLTQDALAQGAEMDPAEVRRLESGQRDPGVRVLARLARGLGVPITDLFDGVR
jgi:transcriptional regulator with XRE-family HTH domain